MKQEFIPPSQELWEKIKKEPFSGVTKDSLRDAHLWIIEKISHENSISNVEVWKILNRFKITKRTWGAPSYYLDQLSILILNKYGCRILRHRKESTATVFYYGFFMKVDEPNP